MNFAALAGGIVLLVVGGKLLIDGAVAVAARLRVHPLLVGLTIVAWGTSAPELAFNSISAARDEGGLVFGNCVGANVCNIGLILGICALIRPLSVSDEVVRREIPLMVAVFILVCGLAAAGYAWGYGRVDGAVLLAAFAVYSARTIRAGRSRDEAKSTAIDEAAALEMREEARQGGPLWATLLRMGAGLGLLGGGGALAANGAVGIARALSVPEPVVGATIVALGTTLPELITGIIATRKGQVELAIGKVVGSCLFNLGAIFGLACVIAPSGVDLSTSGAISLVLMLALGLMLLVMSRGASRMITRPEGAVLVAAYVGFLASQTWVALSAARPE